MSETLDVDKTRAKELGFAYVNSHWKTLTEDEINISVVR